MTKAYWDKKHQTDYAKADWASKPSIFAEDAISYFPDSGKVLDIGTGQGNDAAFFSSKGYEVVGTDLSSSAINNAQQRIKDVKFLETDTSKSLPFEDESFDVAYSHMALHYFNLETTKKIFKDIYRILKPGGVFATITNTIDDPEKDTEPYTMIENGFYQKDGGIIKRYFSIEAMDELTKGLFNPLLLDNQGKTYKDIGVSTLVRFIGKKV